MHHLLRLWFILCVAILMTRADPSPNVLSPEFTTSGGVADGKRLGESVRGGSHPTMVLAGSASSVGDAPVERRTFRKQQVPTPPRRRKTTPPPDLDRIRQNAGRMIEFLDASAGYSSQVPFEVYNAFQITTPPDSDQGLASTLFASSYELIGELPVPGAGVLSWFLGGLVDSFAKKETTPASLSSRFVNIVGRYEETMVQMRLQLSYIYENPGAHVADTYQIPWGSKRTIQVSELGLYDFPESKSPDFTKLIVGFQKSWRRTVTKDMLPQRYWIGAVMPFLGEFKVMNPKDVPPVRFSWSGGPVRVVYQHKDTHYPPQFATQDNVKGNGVNTEAALLETIAKIVSEYPAVFYVYQEELERPFPASPTLIFKGATYWSYLLVPEGAYGNGPFPVPPDDFVNWLFIDDGVGNVTNPNGVAFRQEVFTSWGLKGTEGVQVP